jgi:hypothetical protein
MSIEETVRFKNEWERSEKLEGEQKTALWNVYDSYFKKSVSFSEPQMVRQRSSGLIELKASNDIHGFAYIEGPKHTSQLNAGIKLFYEESGREVVFRFDDYQNNVSGFAWKKTEDTA